MEMPAFNFDVDIPSLREAVGLTHTEAKVLLMLMQEEIATHEQLVVVNSRVRQLMYSLRNKLRAQGINIVNDRDIGYSIPLKYKLRIKNLIEGELVDELNKASEISERLSHE
jgi:cytidylate kinase